VVEPPGSKKLQKLAVELRESSLDVKKRAPSRFARREEGGDSPEKGSRGGRFLLKQSKTSDDKEGNGVERKPSLRGYGYGKKERMERKGLLRLNKLGYIKRKKSSSGEKKGKRFIRRDIDNRPLEAPSGRRCLRGKGGSLVSADRPAGERRGEV